MLEQVLTETLVLGQEHKYRLWCYTQYTELFRETGRSDTVKLQWYYTSFLFVSTIDHLVIHLINKTSHLLRLGGSTLLDCSCSF